MVTVGQSDARSSLAVLDIHPSAAGQGARPVDHLRRTAIERQRHREGRHGQLPHVEDRHLGVEHAFARTWRESLHGHNGQIVVNVSSPRCDAEVGVADVKEDVVARFHFDPRKGRRDVGNQHRCAAVVGRSSHEQRGERVPPIRAEVNVHRAAVDAVAICSCDIPGHRQLGVAHHRASSIGSLHHERTCVGRDGHRLEVVAEAAATCTVVSDGALEIQLTAVGWQMFSDRRRVVDQILGPWQGSCRRACGRKGPENRLVSRRVRKVVVP